MYFWNIWNISKMLATIILKRNAKENGKYYVMKKRCSIRPKTDKASYLIDIAYIYKYMYMIVSIIS